MTFPRRKMFFSSLLVLFLVAGIIQNNQTQGLATDIVFTNLSIISSPAPRDIAVNGDYLYIADAIDGLLVYDITNKNIPVQINGISIPGASSVFVSGYIAYVTAYDRLIAIDVTNPVNAYIWRTYTDPVNKNMTEVFVSGDTAYINDKLQEVFSVDVQNFLYKNGYQAPANAIWYDGFYVYAAQNGTIHQINYDQSNSNSDIQPTVEFLDVTVQGSYVYVATGYDGFLIYDLNNFQVINGINPLFGESMVDVSMFGSYAFISQQLGSIRVVDVSDKLNLRDVTVNSGGPLDNLLQTYVDQNLMYTINSNNDIGIYSWDFQEVVATNTQTVTITQTVTNTTTQTVTNTQTITETNNITTTVTDVVTITNATDTITQTETLYNQTVTATAVVTDTSTKTSYKNVTSTYSTFLETKTVTNTYNTTVEFTKSTSSALTDEIKFTSKKSENAGLPIFMLPLTISTILIIYFVRVKLKKRK